MKKINRIQLGSWQTGPSEGGEWLTFDGDRMAVAGVARLSVWQTGEKRFTADALSPAPGRARFAKNTVFWGPGIVDLDTGKYTIIESFQPKLWPGGGERPFAYEWSPSCNKLLASFHTGDSVQPVCVRLYEYDTRRSTEVWQGSGAPPAAVWFGERSIVLGTGTPLVFDAAGKPVTTLKATNANVVYIGATADEKRLVIVDVNRQMLLVDTATWAVLDCWAGPWLHGCLSADGKFVAVLEAWGKIHFACVKEDRFVPVGSIPVDENAVAIALGDNKLGTIGGGELRWADLSIVCDSG